MVSEINTCHFCGYRAGLAEVAVRERATRAPVTLRLCRNCLDPERDRAWRLRYVEEEEAGTKALTLDWSRCAKSSFRFPQ